MTLTPQQRKELEEARDSMMTYAGTLPEGSEERAEYEEAIQSAKETLRGYSKTTQVSQPTDAAAPAADPTRDDSDPDEDGDDLDLDSDTADSLQELAEQLRAEGYDVGDDPTDLVKGGEQRNFSRQTLVDPEMAAMQREDIDERVASLVDSGKLLPYEGDQIKVSLYALLDATPEGGVSGGLRVYSREEGGVTPAAERRLAVRDLLTTLGARESVGLTHNYTRNESPEEVPSSARLSLTLPDDVPVNEQSAHLANSINALAQERGITFAAATKIYEREKGKVTLKRY